MRAAFFSVGLFVALWGISLFFVDKIVFKGEQDPKRESGFRGYFTQMTPQRQRVLDPPDWASFSLLSIGSVTMLYSLALPKKKAG
ncbi:MAG: hypothetical protein WD648_08000 [Planctomycetaceae bacterium]